MQTKIAKPAEPKRPAGRPIDTPAEDSLPTRLAGLSLGGSESRSVRLPLIGTTAGDVTEAGRKLASTARSAATRAMHRTENRYTIDTGHFLTHDHQHYVVSAVITRIE